MILFTALTKMCKGLLKQATFYSFYFSFNFHEAYKLVGLDMLQTAKKLKINCFHCFSSVSYVSYTCEAALSLRGLEMLQVLPKISCK